ncbi:hypothetical protein [Microbacterium sp. JZ31]|uniref:hypothetical protein n=1 Tax=Microbacterium sp. JZ31 TaxID=1906274 RepID=UPI00193198F3|nr:hypothetical protein [Microbacterium sp. JZ31]
MFAELAGKAQEAAEAQYALDGNTEAYRQTLEASRQSLIDRITDLTGNGDAATALADEIFKIPTETQWKAIADTNEALRRAAAFQEYLNNLHAPTLDIGITTDGIPRNLERGSDNNATVNLYVGGKPLAFSACGWALGIYPYTSGGIHKFAEEFDEAYITLDPKHRNRNLAIHEEVGFRLGAWHQPSMFASAPATAAPA